MDSMDTTRGKDIVFPEDITPNNQVYYSLVAKLVHELPEDACMVKWIKGDQGVPYYCHIIILEQLARSQILSLLEDVCFAHTSEEKHHPIDGYVVGRDSFCTVPFTEHGTEVSRTLVPIDG